MVVETSFTLLQASRKRSTWCGRVTVVAESPIGNDGRFAQASIGVAGIVHDAWTRCSAENVLAEVDVVVRAPAATATAAAGPAVAPGA